MQVLQRRWDPTFSEHSHGFRPKRSAHQAVAKAQQYTAEGHRWVVDLDLEKFFDRVNHDKLMAANRFTSILLVFLGCSMALRNPLNRRCGPARSGGVAGASGRPLPLCRFRNAKAIGTTHGAAGVKLHNALLATRGSQKSLSHCKRRKSYRLVREGNMRRS